MLEGSLPLDEARRLRLHSSKPTLTSLAMHQGEDPRAVRTQGGWKGNREDLMPDTYLRECQVLAICLQERCLQFLRSGGEIEAMKAVRACDLPAPDVGDRFLAPASSPLA
eukprot:10488118-Heterocapsa_arctica.AAC.1